MFFEIISGFLLDVSVVGLVLLLLLLLLLLLGELLHHGRHVGVDKVHHVEVGGGGSGGRYERVLVGAEEGKALATIVISVTVRCAACIGVGYTFFLNGKYLEFFYS